MQLTLSSPEITCDHCIETIRRTVAGIDGAQFVSGNWETKQFAVEVTSGALLDRIGAALEVDGYPLGEAGISSAASGSAADPDWRPRYRVTATSAGADINYDCPCSCDAGFAFDRSQSSQAPEHCCCGRTMLVGREAESRLRGAVGDGEFKIDTQTVTMPWGQPIEVALAIPSDAAHGAHAD